MTSPEEDIFPSISVDDSHIEIEALVSKIIETSTEVKPVIAKD